MFQCLKMCRLLSKANSVKHQKVSLFNMSLKTRDNSTTPVETHRKQVSCCKRYLLFYVVILSEWAVTSILNKVFQTCSVCALQDYTSYVDEFWNQVQAVGDKMESYTKVRRRSAELYRQYQT